MGQAKNRGTFEQRKAEAIEREKSRAKQAQSTPVASGGIGGSGNTGALAIAALIAAASHGVVTTATKGRGGRS